jgi:hypothetical protein
LKEQRKKRLLQLLKAAIVIYTFIYVYYKAFVDYDIDQLIREYSATLEHLSPVALAVAVILFALNWGLEAQKWRFLIGAQEQLSLLQAYKAVFSGSTISLITPNRIGEYAGRVIHLQQMDKIKAAFTTVVGSFAQLSITVIAGSICFARQLELFIPQHSLATQMVVVLCVVMVAGTLILYYNMWLLSAISKRFPLLNKIARYFHVFEEYDSKALTTVLVLSLLRYAVFTLQYLLLLYAFKSGVPVLQAIQVIAIIFFVQAVVPSFTLSDLGIRGASALYFFSFFTNKHLAILLSAYGLWVINLIVPALLGLILILRYRILEHRNK